MAERLLVVDDNERSCVILRQCLEDHGYAVTTAQRGDEALRIVENGESDLVLLDIEMPGLDGWGVLRRIRARFNPTELPVIMVTGRDLGEDVVQALQQGANDYITKPIDMTVAVARIQTQLSLKSAVGRIVALQNDLAQRNAALETAYAKLKLDLEAAAQMQRWLLPTAALSAPRVSFAWQYLPCEALGGDILNFFHLADGSVGFYLLDVSGHGVPAALLSVTLSRLLTPWPNQASLVQQIGADGRPASVRPAEVAEQLNRQFSVSAPAGQFFTLVYAVLDLRALTLKYVIAGHPAPILMRRGEAMDLAHPGLPIGVDAQPAYQEHTQQLQPGDRLYLYSDGISEARSPGGELFGQRRVRETLVGLTASGLDESLRRLTEAAARWNAQPFEDDVSSLAIELRA